MKAEHSTKPNKVKVTKFMGEYCMVIVNGKQTLSVAILSEDERIKLAETLLSTVEALKDN